jgi:tetratricopeptide (TPR) repeat protein
MEQGLRARLSGFAMLACAALAASCVIAPPALAQAEVVYVPSEDLEANRREMASLKKELDADGGGYAFFLEKPELSIHQTRKFITWDLKDDRILVRPVQGSGARVEFKFDALPKIAVIHDTVLGASFYGVRLSDDWAVWCKTSSAISLVCGKFLGEMFSAFRTRHAAIVQGRAAFEAKFRETLARYPDPGSRPPLPEEARRFKVQAESAFERKDIEQALGHYGKACEIAPWWSEGYFNIALLLAETKRYDSAIKNMRRFLLLEPKHPKAREAQDQVYRWEALVEKN